MTIYTIGFTKKRAEEFFGFLDKKGIVSLIDIRLNNKSQLAGFAKGRDLSFFLPRLCSIDYYHEPKFAPTEKLLSDWKKKLITWDEYETEYRRILDERNVVDVFEKNYYHRDQSVCLLCSENEPKHCHRRLLAEYLKDRLPISEAIEIVHL